MQHFPWILYTRKSPIHLTHIDRKTLHHQRHDAILVASILSTGPGSDYSITYTSIYIYFYLLRRFFFYGRLRPFLFSQCTTQRYMWGPLCESAHPPVHVKASRASTGPRRFLNAVSIWIPTKECKSRIIPSCTCTLRSLTTIKNGYTYCFYLHTRAMRLR